MPGVASVLPFRHRDDCINIVKVCLAKAASAGGFEGRAWPRNMGGCPVQRAGWAALGVVSSSSGRRARGRGRRSRSLVPVVQHTWFCPPCWGSGRKLRLSVCGSQGTCRTSVHKVLELQIWQSRTLGLFWLCCCLVMGPWVTEVKNVTICKRRGVILSRLLTERCCCVLTGWLEKV